MISKVIDVMEKELGNELKSAGEKLTLNNLDTIFKLTTSIHNLQCMRDGTWNNSPVLPDTQESPIKKYSNGKYDHNIDALYESYIESKKAYHTNATEPNKSRLIESVSRLMVEVYDMLHSMITDSDTVQERQEIQKQIKKLTGI